jgi:hypothetical protein
VVGGVLVMLPLFSGKSMASAIDNPLVNFVITLTSVFGVLVVRIIGKITLNFKFGKNIGKVEVLKMGGRTTLNSPFEIKQWNYIMDIPQGKRVLKYPRLNLLISDNEGQKIIVSDIMKQNGFKPDFGKNYDDYYKGKDLAKDINFI